MSFVNKIFSIPQHKRVYAENSIYTLILSLPPLVVNKCSFKANKKPPLWEKGGGTV